MRGGGSCVSLFPANFDIEQSSVNEEFIIQFLTGLFVSPTVRLRRRFVCTGRRRHRPGESQPVSAAGQGLQLRQAERPVHSAADATTAEPGTRTTKSPGLQFNHRNFHSRCRSRVRLRRRSSPTGHRHRVRRHSSRAIRLDRSRPMMFVLYYAR